MTPNDLRIETEARAREILGQGFEGAAVTFPIRHVTPYLCGYQRAVINRDQGWYVTELRPRWYCDQSKERLRAEGINVPNCHDVYRNSARVTYVGDWRPL